MSSFEVTPITCPSCQHVFEIGVAETINVTRMPWAKEHILSGAFHAFDCPQCAELLRVDKPFLYVDLEDRRFVQVLPLEQLEGWPRHEEITEESLHLAVDASDPLTSALPASFRIRTCFGVRQLVDKIHLWDAGLDDAVVELVKMELLLARPELRARPSVELTVDEVVPSEDRLIIEAWNRDGAPEPRSYAASLVRYREIDADRARLGERFPGLFERPFRSFRRLVREIVKPLSGDAA